MNFLGLGPGELLLIAMLGLIVFGPGRLPEIAAQVGKMARDLRRSTADMSREFNEAMAPLNELAQLKDELPNALGPAAVMAQNGVAATEETAQSAAVAATAELPPAPTSEWHWEGSAESVTPTEPAAPASFWDWDTSEPVATHDENGSAEAPTQAGNESPIWQWDAAESARRTPDPA